jgi:hypothetical protein
MCCKERAFFILFRLNCKAVLIRRWSSEDSSRSKAWNPIPSYSYYHWLVGSTNRRGPTPQHRGASWKAADGRAGRRPWGPPPVPQHQRVGLHAESCQSPQTGGTRRISTPVPLTDTSLPLPLYNSPRILRLPPHQASRILDAENTQKRIRESRETTGDSAVSEGNPHRISPEESAGRTAYSTAPPDLAPE